MISNYSIIVFLTIFWILYLEINPKIRGIWLRPNSNGVITFCPKGIISVLKAPLFNKDLWRLSFLDINYYSFILVNLIILNCYDKIKYNYHI